jgi:prophage tail gpP-like protein
MRGRGHLKRLLMRCVTTEVQLKDTTYPALVTHALSECGLRDHLLQTSNAANRKIRSGVHVLARIEPRTLDEIIASPTSGGKTIQTVQAKLGENWWQLVKSKLDRAGLFLWDDAEGNFVLSQPNGHQSPTYRVVRWRGKNPNAVNATRSSYKNDTSHRHSEVIVRSRTGGKEYGRRNVVGRFDDPEMRALGYDNPLVLRDTKATSPEEAEFLARRRLAEERREGWRLVYTVAGHTTSSLVAGGGRAVWTPDTVVEVKDDEYGIDGVFYLESCVYRADPVSTETTLRLMRLGDLVFGAEEEG